MKILIIGPSWIGDMMMSQSLYRTLKQIYTNIQIDVLAPEWSKPLLNIIPEVNQSILMPLGHKCLAIKQRRQIGINLRIKKYKQAYILPNSFKSALIPFYAKIPIRIGWCGEMRYGFLNKINVLNKTHFPLMIQRYVALAYQFNSIKHADDIPKPILWPKLFIHKKKIIQNRILFNISTKLQIIGICPGSAFGLGKNWPAFNYAKLVQLILTKSNYHVIIFGSKQEYLIGVYIKKILIDIDKHKCFNLAGKTTLEQAVTLLASCVAVVTNDSGLMHITAALNRPLIALYGTSDPAVTPPLSNKAKIMNFIKNSHKNKKYINGYHQNLINIQHEEVYYNLIKIINNE